MHGRLKEERENLEVDDAISIFRFCIVLPLILGRLVIRHGERVGHEDGTGERGRTTLDGKYKNRCDL